MIKLEKLCIPVAVLSLASCCTRVTPEQFMREAIEEGLITHVDNGKPVKPVNAAEKHPVKKAD